MKNSEIKGQLIKIRNNVVESYNSVNAGSFSMGGLNENLISAISKIEVLIDFIEDEPELTHAAEFGVSE